MIHANNLQSFVDERTLVTIHAPKEGTLIHGTLRSFDLFEVFAEAVKDTPEYLQLLASPAHPIHAAQDRLHDEHDEFWDSIESCELCNELADILDTYAPEGYTFGTHPGDGSDFGYWQIDENDYD